MKLKILVAIALLAAGAGPLMAQETSRDRAQASLPGPVFESLDALATRSAQEGIPTEPLFNKALEGMAKRVPTDLLLPAVTRYAGQLRQSRGAFGDVATGPLLVAGADALQRGVEVDLLQRLGQREEDSPGPSPMAVLVLADLTGSRRPRRPGVGSAPASHAHEDRRATNAGDLCPSPAAHAPGAIPPGRGRSGTPGSPARPRRRRGPTGTSRL